MALPKINDLPSYTLTIPSTNKKIKYRPFLTREQKVLLIALETQDQEKILNAIVDIISACIIDNIDINALTTFDVEYIFTQIRAKWQRKTHLRHYPSCRGNGSSATERPSWT